MIYEGANEVLELKMASQILGEDYRFFLVSMYLLLPITLTLLITATMLHSLLLIIIVPPLPLLAYLLKN